MVFAGLPAGSIVLVTGASGLVGGHVCAALAAKGFRVRAAVRDPSASKCAFLVTLGAELVRVPDLLSDEGWAEAMAGCHGLAHVASPVVLGGGGDEAAIVAQAVEGSERALRFAAEAGTVTKVVVTATMASVCGTQRKTNPDHLWSEADKNDAPETAYSKSKTAAEAKVWELAAAHAGKYDVSTVHPAVVLGPMVEGQPVSSTMDLFRAMLKGRVAPMMFGLCSAADVAAVHVACLEREETAGERYLVCSEDQYSTLELVELAAAGAPAAAAGVDLGAWRADEAVAALAPKKPATDNRKARALLGVGQLQAPATFVKEAAESLLAMGHLA
jgi:nucleoside-diphosphate-sugar epimerase